MLNIIQDFIPAGRRNRPGRANPMRFITIHNTGNASKGAGAKNHAAYIKGNTAANLPVSWHYTIDEREIIQHIPDNEDAFHAGDGSGNGNRQSIGLEICMNSDGDLQRATDTAAELTAMLCQKYNIPVENIRQHQNWSGKNCPQMIRSGRPYDWKTFIGKVKAILGRISNSVPSPTPTPAPTPAPIPEPTPVPQPVSTQIVRGSKVRLRLGVRTYTGGRIASFVFGDTWIVSEVRGDRAVIDKNAGQTNAIMTPVNVSDLILV